MTTPLGSQNAVLQAAGAWAEQPEGCGYLKVVGVDPGWGCKGPGDKATAYGGTGICLVENGRVLHAETILRLNPLETTGVYARRIIAKVHELAGDVVAVEMPQRPSRGRAPRDVIETATLAGMLLVALKAKGVAPARYGKRRPLEDCYPPELWGYRLTEDRRRADPQGSKTRDHERAAYDIALAVS